MANENVCKNCKYFDLLDASKPQTDKSSGACHRWPPKTNDTGAVQMFPTTWALNWCGEYVKK